MGDENTISPAEEDKQDRRIGMVLDGKLTLKQVIGKGGMGSVYRAHQHSMGRDVAVKIMHAAQRDDPELVQRFLNEAKAVSKLDHPNIITVFDFGRIAEQDELLYMVMELLEGRELADVLKDEGPLSPRRVVHILTQVCDGIHHAHDKGLLHRDLKPDNVILIDHSKRARDVAKVLDFGIAQPRYIEGGERLTRTGVMCGTPAYMSPEHILGDQLDPRSDVYSLAVMAFELLTGRRPFVAKTPMRLCMKHLDAPVPLFGEISREAGELPSTLEAVVRSGMAKDPEDRPRTASAFADQLVAALDPSANVAEIHRSQVLKAVKPASTEPTGDYPAPGSTAPVETQGALLTSTDDFDALASRPIVTAPDAEMSTLAAAGRADTVAVVNKALTSSTDAPRALDTMERLDRADVMAERSAPETTSGGGKLKWLLIPVAAGLAAVAFALSGGDKTPATPSDGPATASRATAEEKSTPPPSDTLDTRSTAEATTESRGAEATHDKAPDAGVAPDAQSPTADTAEAPKPQPAAPAVKVEPPEPKPKPKPVVAQKVSIAVTPEDASIFIGGTWVGKGALKVLPPQAGKTLEVTVKRRGYKTKTVELTADSKDLSISLDKERRQPRKKKKKKRQGAGLID